MTSYPYEWYMNVNLVALNGPFKDSVYSIDEKNSFTFGQSPECTLRVNDKTVSTVHFRIEVEQPVVRLVECSGDGGVFLKQRIFRWKHFSAPYPGTLDQPHSCFNTTILIDNELIRVGDYFFQIKIDKPPVCIECGMELSLPRQAMSRLVGDIYHCVECGGGLYEIHDYDDEELYRLVNSIVSVLDKKYREIATNYLFGIKARLIWLEGIHNNKDYVKTIVDYDKLYPKLTDE